MSKSDDSRFEIRQHFKDNSEKILKKTNDVIEATQYAIDCRKFNPDGNLLVYDIVEKTIIGTF